MFQIIIDNLNKLSQLLDFFLASVLLTILLVMTNKKWRGIKDFLLILCGSTISGYLFSSAIRHVFPNIYGLSEQFGNTVASIGVFLVLLLVIEKDYWKIAVEKVIKDKINLTK